MTRIAVRRTLLTGAALAVAGVLIVGCSPQGSSSPASGSSAKAASSPSGFADALTAWKQAWQGPLATMNTYLTQAAGDLRRAGDPGYDTAISQLAYLASLPDTDATPTQQAGAQADGKALDAFFGTPGLGLS
jgi:hypothetical protein